MRKTRIYKCDVIKCRNNVFSPGAFCKNCLNKLFDEEWIIFYCFCCSKISSIIKTEEIKDSPDDRFVPVFCPDCSSYYFDDNF